MKKAKHLATLNKKLAKARKRLDFLSGRLVSTMSGNHAKAVRAQLNKVWSIEEKRVHLLPKR